MRRQTRFATANAFVFISLLLLSVVAFSCLDTEWCSASGAFEPQRAATKTPADIEEFELVESVPVETNMDNAGIRNTHEVWLDMIRRAVSTLDVAEFYVSDAPGEPLEDVLTSIVDAAKGGVRVRFVVDSKMYRTYPERLDWLSRQKNVFVRTIDMGRISGGVMHAKYFIVDGKEIFLGSQNFDWRALKHIHEIGCRVKSKKLVGIFSDLFELDWKSAEGIENKAGDSGSRGARAAAPGATPGRVSRATPTAAKGAGREQNVPHKTYQIPLTGLVNVPYPYGTVPSQYGSKDSVVVWPVYSPTGFIPDERLWDEQNIVKLIDGARREIDVQVLTYSTISNGAYYPVLDNALRNAAARGVLVKLIVSDWAKSHPQIDCLKSLGLMPNIEVKLSTIPEWSGGFVPYARVEHCKYMVVDDNMSWVGSSNWERSYFYETRNVGVVVRSSAIAQMLREVFYKDWNGEYTYTVRPDVQYQPPKRS